jgi:hypothetical protein
VCDTLGDGGLSRSRFADKNGVILGAAAQDLEYTANLLITADHRVEFAVPGPVVQVNGVFPQGLIGVLCRRAGHLLAFAQLPDCSLKPVLRDSGIFHQLRCTVLLADHRQ